MSAGGVRDLSGARILTRITSLVGVTSAVEMRETRAAGRVVYTGTYRVLPHEVFDITITAWPEKSNGSSEPLTMTYRERMWAEADTSRPPAPGAR